MAVMVQRATGSGAVSFTVAPSAQQWQLIAIKCHLSAVGGAGNLTATMDATGGAAYDTVVYSVDMTSVTNLLYQPTVPIPFMAGDELDIAWTNGSSRTYGIEVMYRIVQG